MMDCVHHVQANINSDGEFEVKIRSRIEYAPGEWAQAEIPIPDDLQGPVRAALQAIVDDAQASLEGAADEIAAKVIEHAQGESSVSAE